MTQDECWPGCLVLHQGGLPVQKRSPIQALTGTRQSPSGNTNAIFQVKYWRDREIWATVTQDHWKWHHSIDRVYELLFVFHCNYTSMAVFFTVFENKRDIGRKTQNFHAHLPVHDRVRPPRISSKILTQTARVSQQKGCAKYCEGARTSQTDDRDE